MATVFESLKEKFGDAVLGETIAKDGMSTLEVDAQSIFQVLDFLKNHPVFSFNFLTTLCGIHDPSLIGREITVMYQVHSWVQNNRLRLKAFLPESAPEIRSITDLWPAANWMERETYDFFGVQFVGHPDLRRILNVDEMEVFPMRKEFALEDGTRTDKDDRFFGRDGHEGQSFD